MSNSLGLARLMFPNVKVMTQLPKALESYYIRTLSVKEDIVTVNHGLIDLHAMPL